MVEKVFWRDPYLSTLNAKVDSVEGACITLDQTIFYAFSGGQESDRGSINGYPVLQAEKHQQEIVYTLPTTHSLQPGQEVEICIDWERRYRLMRLHFACEISLELICRTLKGIEKIGAHIAEDKARIDFRHPVSLAPLLPELESEVNRLAQADRPIISAFSDTTKEIRYWEIEGFARVPCGGTHLKRSGEIGQVRLKRKNPGKGKERVEIFIN